MGRYFNVSSAVRDCSSVVIIAFTPFLMLHLHVKTNTIDRGEKIGSWRLWSSQIIPFHQWNVVLLVLNLLMKVPKVFS